MARIVEPLLTVADLDCMPDDGNRYEVIEGVLYVSRAPGLTHQRVLGSLLKGFVFYLDQNPIGEIIATPGVILSNFDGVIPDLVFISHERRSEIASGERVTGAPEIVIEIVSPGAENERRDRIVKRQLYAAYGVKEYWVVNPQSRTIEVYVHDGQALSLNAVLGIEDELGSSLLPGFGLRVENIFSFEV
jgi:Uma2 family endonuclease